MAFDIFLTLFLVLLNGFFVAAEFAIVKVRSSAVEVMVREGNRFAKLAQSIIRHLDAYLSATQLGITLASLGLGWIGESVVSRIIINIFHGLNLNLSEQVAHNIALPTSFALITVLHIVFGELAPKSLALQRPESTSLFVAVPLKGFYILFRPFIWLLNGFANAVLRALGIQPAAGHEVHSAQELLYILEQSKTGGAIEVAEHQILENVFDFHDRPVKQVMVPRTRIAGVDVEDGFDAAVETLLTKGYSRLPVYSGSLDNIIGLVYAKDLLQAYFRNENKQLSDYLRPVSLVPETKKLANVLRDLQQQKVHMAVVIDEFGGTAGLVTLEDIIEELVGEIQDEYDNEVPFVEKHSESEFTVRADTAVIDANDWLPRPLPESEDYDTVGGYASWLFNTIPEVGDSMEADGYIVTIVERQENKLQKVHFRLLPQPEVDEI